MLWLLTDHKNLFKWKIAELIDAYVSPVLMPSEHKQLYQHLTH